MTIAIAAQALGAAVGFVIPALFVSVDDEDELFREHVAQSLICQAGLGIAVFLACLFFFKNKPATPPSATAFQLLDKPGQFKSSITTILSNKDLIWLMLAFGGIQGTFNTLGTVVGEATGKYGYTSDDASIFGALFIVGGVAGSAGFGIYVETTKKYKPAILVICVASVITCLCSYVIMPHQVVWLLSLMCFLQGAAMIPVMAVAMDLGVELTYPVGESFSAGVLMSAG